MELWTDGTSTFANFSCDAGYTMDGQTVMQCRNDGTWNFNAPSCGRLLQNNIYENLAFKSVFTIIKRIKKTFCFSR